MQLNNEQTTILCHSDNKNTTSLTDYTSFRKGQIITMTLMAEEITTEPRFSGRAYKNASTSLWVFDAASSHLFFVWSLEYLSCCSDAVELVQVSRYQFVFKC